MAALRNMGLLLAIVGNGLLVWAAPARGEECARPEFEIVVGEAAAALRDLTQKNKPVFQARLRLLRDKRGWTQDQFLKEAQPLVQDDKIAGYDEQSSAFLAKIEAMGSSGAGGGDTSCKALALVRAQMKSLVDVQTAKWAYMFERIDRELVK